MSDPERAARAQLSSDYDRITTDGYASRWSLENPGNREILQERDETLANLTNRLLPGRPKRVLDLGCGNLSILPASIHVEVRVGVDLLMSRLINLATSGDDTPTVNGDGAHLPFPDGSFDVVVMSTMMTSVLDERTRLAVAAEVVRTLSRGGAVVWYDMRMPNPGNDAIRAIGKRELRRLFPTLHGEVCSLTLVPFIARRLGRATQRRYALLRRVPLLRSHLAACLVKIT